MYSEILGAADDGKLSLLMLLDLSAAFDLVDHSILLKRLESKYSFDGLTLEWFENHLNPSMYAAVGQNQILLTLQWVSHKDLFLDHCCFLYTLRSLKNSHEIQDSVESAPYK